MLLSTKQLAQLEGVLINAKITTGQLQTFFSTGGGYAVNNGGVFTIHESFTAPTNDYSYPATVTLPISTLDSALIGTLVFIDTGGNKWRLATVTSDGTTFKLPSGTAVDLSVQAVAMANIVGYVTPSTGTPQSETFSKLGTSANSTTWFSNSRCSMYTASAITTAGAIAPGSDALVEIGTSPSTWQMVTL